MSKNPFTSKVRTAKHKKKFKQNDTWIKTRKKIRRKIMWDLPK